MSRTIVCDTGPLLHLSEADALDLLKLAGDVLIPPSVATEFRHLTSTRKLPDWAMICRLDRPTNDRVSEWIAKKVIDSGEAEAIGLALQVNCDWFLTDDTQARVFAESLGLEVHGSVGLLLWAVAQGHIDSHEQAQRLLDALVSSSLWISERVIREAAKAIEDLLQE